MAEKLIGFLLQDLFEYTHYQFLSTKVQDRIEFVEYEFLPRRQREIPKVKCGRWEEEFT